MSGAEALEAKRRRFIPARTRKVALKSAPACVYLYEIHGQPYAAGFFGAQMKPAWHNRFRSEADRAAKITKHFESAAAISAYRSERDTARAARNAAPRKLQVGHILRTSWGYDQTNIDFYEVTALVGARMVEVRKVASNTVEETGYSTGKSVPVAGRYVGDPMRCTVRGGFDVKIDGRYAQVWDGTPQRWSAYA